MLYIREKTIFMVPMSFGMFVRKLVTCKERNKIKWLVIRNLAKVRLYFIMRDKYFVERTEFKLVTFTLIKHKKISR